MLGSGMCLSRGQVNLALLLALCPHPLLACRDWGDDGGRDPLIACCAKFNPGTFFIEIDQCVSILSEVVVINLGKKGE